MFSVLFNVADQVHPTKSSRKAQDGLYHQRQAVLRNAANAESGLLSVIELAWAWRRAATRPLLRLVSLFLLTICCVAGFTLASGYSSRISTSLTNEVLLSGQSCATINQTSLFASSAADLSQYYFPFVSRGVENAANYALQCYNGSTSALLECSTFPQARLPVQTVQTDAGCPFDNKFCKSAHSNLVIDTGLIDSHEHLGINASPDQRFQYRNVLHCAPMVVQGYKSVYNVSADRSYTRYHYGKSLGISLDAVDFTYSATNDGWDQTKYLNTSAVTLDYTLG
jgi:hypothetical protein